ncbi:MAG: hypothetical protein AABX83_04095 [Nanoarchaeota archaeon]
MELIQKLREAYKSGCEKADLDFMVIQATRNGTNRISDKIFVKYSEVEESEKSYGFLERFVFERGYNHINKILKAKRDN